MKKEVNKTEAQKKISEFFSRDSFTLDEVRKIKRLAMKFKIKLGIFRKSFCKKCLSQLKGRISITKTHKAVVCSACGFKNKFRISQK